MLAPASPDGAHEPRETTLRGMTHPRWPALELARRRDGPPRLPFVPREDGAGRRARLRGGRPSDGPARLAPGVRGVSRNDAFVETPSALALRLPSDERDARLAEIHATLRDEGLITAWRDEPYPLRDVAGGEHATIERAASRFWGTMTWGAHCNGYVADGAAGRRICGSRAAPSPSRRTPAGSTTWSAAACRVGSRRARRSCARAGKRRGSNPRGSTDLVEGEVLEIDCDIAEGRQHEHLFVFDLALPAGFVPRIVDGEVAEHRLHADRAGPGAGVHRRAF